MVKVRNADKPIASPITFLQMLTDAPLCGFDIRIITVIQDHQLNVAEDILDRIIIGTAFGQRNPMQFQLPHQATGLARLARMGRVPVQDNPNRLVRIPASDLLHEVTNLFRALLLIAGPSSPSAGDLIGHK